LHGASWPCYLKQSYLTEVRSVPGIATAAPVFMTALYDDSGTQSVYVGVKPTLLALKRGWRITGRFPQRHGDLLIGAEVARRSRWRLGERVRLPGVKGGSGTVAGLLAPTQGAEDSFLYLPLQDAQRLFHHPRELTHL